MKVYIAIVDYDYGTSCYVARTQEAVDAQLAEYCRDWWQKDGPSDQVMPDTDREVIDRYFGWISEIGGAEAYETFEQELED